MSGYLIDTHVWLWMQAEPARLRAETRELVTRADAHAAALALATKSGQKPETVLP